MTATPLPPRTKILVGWIAALPDDRLFLEKLGVQIVGPYDDNEKHFSVQVSDDVLHRLDEHWGRFYWSLREWQ